MISVHEMVTDLDETLNRLIENAKVLSEIEDRRELCHEFEALKKTQESLIAHSMHISNLIEKEKITKRSVEKRVEDIRKKFLMIADLNASSDECERIVSRKKKSSSFGRVWRRQKSAKARISASK